MKRSRVLATIVNVMMLFIQNKASLLLEKIKAHKIQIILLGTLIVVIIFLSFKIHWNKPPTPSVARSALPTATQDTKSFTLITEPDQGTAPVLSLIASASSSIDLVMYEMTDKEICDALIAAANREVSVRVLLNGGYYGKQENNMNKLAYTYLQQHAVPVRWTPASFALTHQKTLLVDNEKALIMTWNFVPKYYPTGRDFGVIDTSSRDVSAIEQTFSADWNNTEIASPLGDDLVWSPSSENDMLLIIHSAQKTLDIYKEEMNYDVITQAIKNAHARGVAVRIIMTYSTQNKPIFNDLEASGIHIHTFSGKKKLYIHAKSIIADNTHAFVGSENFSFTSLNKNRELGIFLNNTDNIGAIEKTFITDWYNSKEYVIKK